MTVAGDLGSLLARARFDRLQKEGVNIPLPTGNYVVYRLTIEPNLLGGGGIREQPFGEAEYNTLFGGVA